jgi:hypothetical protein
MSRRVHIVVAGALLLLARFALAGDASWRVAPAGESHAARYTRTSFYVAMRDGVPIAVDLYLPEGASDSARVPAIVRFTRYWRAPQLRWFVRPFLDRPWDVAARFLANGYAWLDVDVRGSGASGGVQRSLWSDEELADSSEILDWIARQPWSSGAVGATGDSYDGTAAELALVTHHPALRAVAPRFSLFDAYTDVGWPGGMHLSWFTEVWGRLDNALDRGALRSAFPWWTPLFVAGPRPVDGPGGAPGVTAAQAAHAANFDVSRAARAVTFRDDSPGGGIAAPPAWSPCCGRRAAIESSRVPVFSVDGWWDGAYANAAIHRFDTYSNPGSRLTIGPWNHGGDQQLEPLAKTRRSEFDHAGELLRFFDHYLKGSANGWQSESPVRYFTTGEGHWHEAQRWPPASEPRQLVLGRELRGDSSTLTYDPAASTGTSSRWHALAEPTWTEYPDRAERDRHNLVYESETLAAPLTVTGHPVLRLSVRSDQPDAAVFAYLEDVDPQGRVGYVTEGCLRALHRRVRPARDAPYRLRVPYHSYARADAEPLVPGERAELALELLPISHQFRAGHRLRLALAAGDRDQFAPLPGLPATLRIDTSPDAHSALELPVVPEGLAER